MSAHTVIDINNSEADNNNQTNKTQGEGGNEDGNEDGSEDGEDSEELTDRERLEKMTNRDLRQATILGIEKGELPEFPDAGVVVEKIIELWEQASYDLDSVLEKNRWAKEWLSHRMNNNIMEEELAVYIENKVKRIIARFELLQHGALCSLITRPCKRIPKIRFGALFIDLCCICLWVTCCDWWLGKWYRRYIKAKYLYYSQYVFEKATEILFHPSTIYSDEDLIMYNPYHSNAYRFGNIYALVLLLTIATLFAGLSITSAAVIMLLLHPTSIILNIQFFIGMSVLGCAVCSLPCFCRCTL